jgi:hypothetical protein
MINGSDYKKRLTALKNKPAQKNSRTKSFEDGAA